jgi:hypothetical protein
VFNECHGREPWCADIDLSGTMGWFTTMHPLPIADMDVSSEDRHDDSNDLARAICLVTNVRHRIPGNGWPYFASRYLHTDGRAAFAGHAVMEVLINYTG